MPCSDSRDYDDRERNARDMKALHDANKKLTAMLCGVFNSLARRVDENLMTVVVGGIDEKESGVLQAEVWAWWREHKAADEERRAREAAAEEAARALREEAIRKATLRATAMSKLTPDEIAALNLK